MSDALSDIRKSERNRPQYSQIELEQAVEKARKEGYAEGVAAERERVLKEADIRIRDIGMHSKHEAVMLQVLESLRSQPEKQQEGERE